MGKNDEIDSEECKEWEEAILDAFAILIILGTLLVLGMYGLENLELE